MSIFPAGWQVQPLHQVCSEIVDCLNKTAPVVDGPTPYKMIRTTNVKNGRVNLEETRFVDEAVYRKWTRRFKPRRHDVILTREAPLGEVGLLRSDEHVFLGQRTMAYRADPKKLDQRFLYYSLLGPTLQAQIRMYGAGSTVEHMRVPQAESLLIPFPDLASQQKIAAILSAYDDLIANNQRRIALLERMAEDIYREWFVRLRFPGHEQVKIEKVVPQGWSVRNLGDVLKLCYGKALKDKVRLPGVIPVYGSGGVVGTHSVALAEGPGIVVGRKGNVGSIFWSEVAFFPIDTVYYVRSDTSLYHLVFLLRSMNFINNDAAVPDLSRQQAYANKLLFPPKELINQFTSKVKSLFEMRRVLSAQIEQLKATRDALLPRLISGQLHLDGLDIQFPPGMARG